MERADIVERLAKVGAEFLDHEDCTFKCLILYMRLCRESFDLSKDEEYMLLRGSLKMGHIINIKDAIRG